MNIFDILGPVMVGPSSSHTAGAARIGYAAVRILQEKPVYAEIILHGSFAETGVGHGTDKALIGGLLGFLPDDMRIPESFELAKKEGLAFHFQRGNMKDAHPNTAVLILTGQNGRHVKVQAASVGGGRIEIHNIDDTEVRFTAEKPTLIVYNQDQPGYVASVTGTLSMKNVNIATMHLYRDKRGGFAVMVLETDQTIPEEAISTLKELKGIKKVIYINVEEDHGI